jgi:hypothetical protein
MAFSQQTKDLIFYAHRNNYVSMPDAEEGFAVVITLDRAENLRGESLR